MSEIVIVSFGDLLINRRLPNSAFEHLMPLFDNVDVIIGNYEGVLTNRPQPIGGRRGMTISSVKNAESLSPFSVLSLANNHALDSGITGLSDTLETLRSSEVQTTGAGLSYSDAWQPAYIVRNGIRIAVFGVTGVYRTGTEANNWQGGVAALRSRDYYASPFSGAVVPGVLPEVHTKIDEEDWKHFSDKVKQARSQAQVIITLIHWGDHTRAYAITGFEKEIAQRMAEVGVNLLVGHHHHQMRGFQWHKQMLTCYGLGNAVFDQPCMISTELTDETGFQLTYPSRFSVAVINRYQNQRITATHLLPLFIEEESPVPICRGSSKWHEFIEIQNQCACAGNFENLVNDRNTVWNGFNLFDLNIPDQ